MPFPLSIHLSLMHRLEKLPARRCQTPLTSFFSILVILELPRSAPIIACEGGGDGIANNLFVDTY
jgi:hypothetical protein